MMGGLKKAMGLVHEPPGMNPERMAELDDLLQIDGPLAPFKTMFRSRAGARRPLPSLLTDMFPLSRNLFRNCINYLTPWRQVQMLCIR